mgnify:CR=1 FL=1
MFRKGQLVQRVAFSGIHTSPGDYIREQWSKPAVVVKGTYERSKHHSMRNTVVATELYMCIDVLLDGKELLSEVTDLTVGNWSEQFYQNF